MHHPSPRSPVGSRPPRPPRGGIEIGHVIGSRAATRRVGPAVLAAALAAVLAACSGAGATEPPLTSAGTASHPREVNIVAKDYLFLPSEVRLVPGETVLLHVINGGLATHEVVIGDAAVQAAWEVAEAATVDAPPGPTPSVSVPPGEEGVRIVVASGERRDVLWTVPSAGGPLIVGCHIPGHFARGMQVPVRFVAPSG